MDIYTFHIECHIELTCTHANDNRVWTADPWLAMRMFAECRLRYLRIDPHGLTPEGRRLRLLLIHMSLDNIQFVWHEINNQNGPTA